MMVPLSDNESKVLANIADLIIERVLAHGGAQTRKPTGEVRAVETLTRDGFAGIARAWDPLLASRGYAIDLRAVFVHSRPQVRWSRVDGSSGRCELADLLVVIDHKGPGIDRDRRAVLIQSKLLKNGQIKLRGKEWVQFELLSEWPTFSFVTPGYAPKGRDFLDENVCKNALNGAEYGGIDLRSGPPICVQEMVSPPRATTGRISFGELLVGMARGLNLCGREARLGGADDWSATVEELLQVTAALPITIASAVPRGQSHSVGMFVAQASYGAMATLSAAATRGEGSPPADKADIEDPGGPISTIKLTLTSAEHIEREDV